VKSATSSNATANTGSGSGGSSGVVGVPGTGNGGSGVVILRYPSSLPAALETTGSPTVSISGGNRIYTFTGDGSITF
jgi:hypothetical protein